MNKEHRPRLAGPIVGHVGDGNFHCLLLVDNENPEQMQTGKDLCNRMGQ